MAVSVCARENDAGLPRHWHHASLLNAGSCLQGFSYAGIYVYVILIK